MLGRVETKDILSLARSGIDGANMLSPLHFPNRRYHAVLLDGVIGDIFRRGLSRRTLACCISLAFNRRALIVRHFYSNTPLRTSSACLGWFKELLHTARASVYQNGTGSVWYDEACLAMIGAKLGDHATQIRNRER